MQESAQSSIANGNLAGGFSGGIEKAAKEAGESRKALGTVKKKESISTENDLQKQFSEKLLK